MALLAGIGSALSALGSGAMASIPSIASFGLNQFGSALSSHRSWENTKKQMLLADLLNRRYTVDSYGLMRTGLEQAGYNPLLALGSSPNQAIYSGSGPATDSDAGDQAVNSAMNAQNFKYQNKLFKEQYEGQKLDNEEKRLKNEKLKADLRTSPSKLVTEAIDKGDIPDDVKKGVELGKKIVSNNTPSFVSINSAKGVQAQKDKIVKSVNQAINGSKKEQLKLSAVMANPALRSIFIGYVGYKAFKHINSTLRKNLNYSNNFNNSNKSKYSSTGVPKYQILDDKPEWKVDYNEVQRRMSR